MRKKLILGVMALAMATLPAMAQQRGKGARDPKMMAAKMADKLNFTDAQKAQLEALNAKYPGADFDKMKYREEFRGIMTDEQKKKAEEWKAQHKARNNK
jgi:Spy/CpxP family protein refolding chaperone